MRWDVRTSLRSGRQVPFEHRKTLPYLAIVVKAAAITSGFKPGLSFRQVVRRYKEAVESRLNSRPQVRQGK